MTPYYVATLSTCVVVDAADETDARVKGGAELQAILGRPVQIRLARPATAEEIEFQRWCDKAARELQ